MSLIEGATGDWEVVIGMEIHAQVTAAAKLFSGAATAFGAEPNSQVSFVDAAFPGMLPVINRKCVEQAVRTGLGLNARINLHSVFDRKNYFYPDLPPGYQISQYLEPVVGKGEVVLDMPDGATRRVGITRVHLEQDAGKSLHDQDPARTFVDLNRAGIALMEIVSEPDLRSAAEAGAYLRKVRSILRYLGTCDGNMEEGSLRADVNVSVRKPGAPFGTRCEIKNLNSVRFIEHAVDCEARRQIAVIEEGGAIVQETRLYDPGRGETRAMRSKEEAHDYRYFPDPDLLPLVLEQSWVDEIRASLPELPDTKKARFVRAFGLSAYDADVLVAEKETADYYEAVVGANGAGGKPKRDPKTAANWVTGELFGHLNREGIDITASPVSAEALGGLIDLIADGTITGRIAKDVFDAMMESGKPAAAIVAERGLKQITDTGAIEAIVDRIIAGNPKQVEAARANPKAVGWFVGQVMKATGGKANPQVVNALLARKLAGQSVSKDESISKIEVLRSLSFGQRVAEEEIDKLGDYFVQTDYWRRIYDGEIDIIYGTKGSGKSAIYLLLQKHEDDLFDRNVLFVAAENVRGAPAFKGLEVDPPTSEREFINLWKLYFLALVGRALRDYGIENKSARNVIGELESAELLPRGKMTLAGILKLARDYVREQMKSVRSIEGGVKLDPNTGAPTGLSGKIIFEEPSAEDRKLERISVDTLFDEANQALGDQKYKLWLLLDRLDVAFMESSDLEGNALRALFRAYRDLHANEHIKLKIFLRSDIWKRITEEGFREASHLARSVILSWNRESLLNLVITRAASNENLLKYYDVARDKVLGDAKAQRELFYKMFPEQVDPGSRKSTTFDWMLSRTQDGTGQNAPRELIHLLGAIRDEQVQRLERGEDEPAGDRLFDAVAIKAALPVVSKARLEQTIFAEYPETREIVSRLEGEKAEQSTDSLSKIWKVDRDEAVRYAAMLVDVGIFEQRGSKEQPSYWVPFLYRSALKLVQGKADE